MSTSTGPAFRLKENTDLFSIPSQLAEVSKVNERALVQQFFDDVVFRWTSYAQLEKSPSAASTPKTFRDCYNQESREFLNDLKNVTDNMSANISFRAKLRPKLLFAKNFTRDEVYVRLGNVSYEAVQVFKALDFIDGDMEYFNSSDSQLEKISEEEWAYRKKAWEETLPRLSTLPVSFVLPLHNEAYFAYEVSNPKSYQKYIDFIKHPTVEELRTKVFQHLYLAYYFKKVKPPQKGSNFDWSPISHINGYQFSDDISKLLGSKNHEAEIERIRQETIAWVDSHPVGF